jgi:hypothetical protein
MLFIKHKLIVLFSPIRKIWSKIYCGILQYYLGAIIIELNEIDKNVLDNVLYSALYNNNGSGYPTYEYKYGRKPMGCKISKLENLNKKISNTKLGLLIVKLNEVKNDHRNPLIHARYFLGYGNQREWLLKYKYVFFDKKSKKSKICNFKIREAKNYLCEIKKSHEELNKLMFNLLF